MTYPTGTYSAFDADMNQPGIQTCYKRWWRHCGNIMTVGEANGVLMMDDRREENGNLSWYSNLKIWTECGDSLDGNHKLEWMAKQLENSVVYCNHTVHDVIDGVDRWQVLVNHNKSQRLFQQGYHSFIKVKKSYDRIIHSSIEWCCQEWLSTRKVMEM